MYPSLRIGLPLVALMFGACQKSETSPAGGSTARNNAGAASVPLVKAEERSASFAAVQRQLELGGTLYGYVDIDGDVQKLTSRMQEFLTKMGESQPMAGMAARQDLPGIATTLGLTDVKALGVSSVPDGNGFFRNRLFIHTTAERHGLLAALGGKPAPWRHLALAPADAAFYGESELDFGIAYKTLKEVVNKVAGERMGTQLESVLQKAGEAATISYLDLIYGLKGRMAVVMRVDDTKTFRWPGPQPMVIPAFSLVACAEGVGQVIEPSLAKMKELRRRDDGALHVYELAQATPIEGIAPALVIDGATLYFTTSLPFLNECRARTSGLAQAPEFQQAIAAMGREGNGLTYVSPRLFERIRAIETLNPSLPPQLKSMFEFMLAQMPTPSRPLVSVRTNLDDGILVRSYLNRSLKQDLAAVSIYNPVTVGLMAAMAIPAFQKVRVASQEKAVLNNLRMLTAAADQYYLENGKTTATLDDLVGPTKYVRALEPIVGEDYRTLRFRQGEPLRLRLPSGQVVQYPPGMPGTSRPAGASPK